MENPVIDRFHQICALLPTQELNALTDEIKRLHSAGMSMKDIGWRLSGALYYVYECRVEGRDPETGRKTTNEQM